MTKIKIPQLIPFIGEEELRNLEIVIKNRWITEGPFSEQFLHLIKEFTGSKHALLVNNGTLALYLGLLGLGIKTGDEVIIPDFTFIASGSSVVFAGGTPVFVDVNRENYQMEISNIEAAITENTKAIMPVHIYGQSVDMDPILTIANKYNLKVIEDAAQAFGVFYKGKHAGTIGDLGIISFFADKTITTGEGAVILINNDDLYESIRLIRNQGRPNSGTFIHLSLGMNFRLTDLQCAIGVAQLNKYDNILKAKISNYRLYNEYLNELDNIKFMKKIKHSNFVPFRAPLTTNNIKVTINALEKNGIQIRGYFYPMHKQPCFSTIVKKSRNFSNSIFLNKYGLALPVYPGLSMDNIEYICNTIKSVNT